MRRRFRACGNGRGHLGLRHSLDVVCTGARKRSGEPNDADSEDTIIYSSASEESSYDSDFVPVTGVKQTTTTHGIFIK
ncbi:hypothetical protein HPB50_002669 [Hyalomma asiaticum]|uniref:Uncharacterized protein n=1 Tax=Hyalomma asiaticum TaxID=266040 RepID=A0ACB7SM01_HYAAI|nr:hypothetical protein HPB50_002669 [Hyalomma asiaticum]